MSKGGREPIEKYIVCYADPPWRYSAKRVQGAAEHHYPTMSIEDLCALPVADLMAPDSALFLWATFPQLPDALRLIEAWGFDKTIPVNENIIERLNDIFDFLMEEWDKYCKR